MPSSSEVAAGNISRLRCARKMSYVELSERMGALGQPIPVIGLRRIEKCERRIDVDELAAFGRVFGIAAWLLTLSPTCSKCAGAPPAGFSCLACGAGSVGDERS
jgi:hypothetical protein